MPLPEIPKSVTSSFVAEQSTSQPDLRDRIHELDKALLRVKLHSKQEDSQLAELWARREKKNKNTSNNAKLEALNMARSELIAWMEAGLGKASVQICEQDSETSVQAYGDQLSDQSIAISTQIDRIRRKYTDYIATRKAILILQSSHSRSPVFWPRQATDVPNHGTDTDFTPMDHLLTPYIETLLAIQDYQKKIMAHKTHASLILNKSSRSACQALDRLAEESQLLSSYPMKNPPRRRSGIGSEIAKSSHNLDISNHVKPWIEAADSAKMATLEAVADMIEGGQLALEGCIESLQDIERLLGQGSETATTEPSATHALEGGDHSSDGGGTGSSGKPANQMRDGDPWSRLHGNIGFVCPEDVACWPIRQNG